MTTAIEKFQKFEDLLMLQISHIFNDYEEKDFQLFKSYLFLLQDLEMDIFIQLFLVWLLFIQILTRTFLLLLSPLSL